MDNSTPSLLKRYGFSVNPVIELFQSTTGMTPRELELNLEAPGLTSFTVVRPGHKPKTLEYFARLAGVSKYELLDSVLEQGIYRDGR